MDRKYDKNKLTSCTKLSDDEWDILNKIASKSKMDCWFLLKEKSPYIDVVYDLENEEELTLYDGISILDSGITDLKDYDLNDSEQKIYFALISRLLIHEVEEKNRILYNLICYCEDVCGVDILNNLDEVSLTEDEYQKIMDIGATYES